MKISAVILSFTILIQSFNISFSDVLQLNELIEHAQFHKKQYGDDFLTFLSKHYGEDKAEHQQQHKEEAPQHEKLPFNQQHLPSIDFQVPVLVTTYLSLEKHIFKQTKKTGFYYVNIYSSLFKNGIFQPPKHA